MIQVMMMIIYAHRVIINLGASSSSFKAKKEIEARFEAVFLTVNSAHFTAAFISYTFISLQSYLNLRLKSEKKSHAHHHVLLNLAIGKDGFINQ